jgi:dynein intermediate chain 3, axonemal
MDWTKQNETDCYVKPTAISSLEHSQRDIISCIKWLAQNVACDANGKIEITGDFTNRIFITTSFDGTICFWNLNWTPSGGHAVKKANKFVEKMPQELQESESAYSPLNKVFHPIFRLLLNMPISCLTIDEGEFIRHPISMPQKLTMKTRLQYNIQPCEVANFESRMKCGTFYCDLISATWEGYDFDQGAMINEEPAKVEKYAHIHDSVILNVERNPFINELDFTIGGNVIALWHREWTSGPLIWRERPSRLTAGKWSLNRPAVFYLTREDGIVEAWDLLGIQ